MNCRQCHATEPKMQHPSMGLCWVTVTIGDDVAYLCSSGAPESCAARYMQETRGRPGRVVGAQPHQPVGSA